MDLKLNITKEELNKNKILITGIAIALFAVWYGYNKIYKPSMITLEQMKKQAYEKGANSEIVRKIAFLQNEMAAYKGYFGKETDISWLMGRVSTAAKESGIKIVSLNPAESISGDYYFSNMVNLTTSGTFHQLGDFVAMIENSKEFMRVDKLVFKKNENFLDADIVISAYFLK